MSIEIYIIRIQIENNSIKLKLIKLYTFSRLPKGLQGEQTKGEQLHDIRIEPAVKMNDFERQQVVNGIVPNRTNAMHTVDSFMGNIATESTNNRMMHSSESVTSTPKASNQKW